MPSLHGYWTDTTRKILLCAQDMGHVPSTIPAKLGSLNLGLPACLPEGSPGGGMSLIGTDPFLQVPFLPWPFLLPWDYQERLLNICNSSVS